MEDFELKARDEELYQVKQGLSFLMEHFQKQP